MYLVDPMPVFEPNEHLGIWEFRVKDDEGKVITAKTYKLDKIGVRLLKDYRNQTYRSGDLKDTVQVIPEGKLKQEDLDNTHVRIAGILL